MSDLKSALSDIDHIRQLAAASTMFRGYGPAVIASTGVLAIGAAAVQAMFQPASVEPVTFIKAWVAIALLSVALIGTEMVARSRRHHGHLSNSMLKHAAAQFIPAGIAGAAITCVLLVRSTEFAWVLPGLWSILIALGVFSSAKFLPPAVWYVGAWYLTAGCAVLWLSGDVRQLSPWSMGVPFGVGQIALAFILFRSLEVRHAETE